MKKGMVDEHFMPKNTISPCKIFQNAFCRVKNAQKVEKMDNLLLLSVL
jgi:hypothetical protein